MTREEAINIMNVIVHMLEKKYDTDRVEEAVEMAIKALEQEPCEDCISREYILSKTHCCLDDFADDEPCCVDADDIKEAPSVQPKPKTDVLDKIRAIVIKWQNDTWTDNLSYECMCEIADIVAESE